MIIVTKSYFYELIVSKGRINNQLNLIGSAAKSNQETKSNSYLRAEFIWKDKTKQKNIQLINKYYTVSTAEMGGKEYKKLKKQLKKDKHADLEEPIE